MRSAVLAALLLWAAQLHAGPPYLVVSVPDARADRCEFTRGAEVVLAAVEVDAVRGEAAYGYRICRVPLDLIPNGENWYAIRTLAVGEQSAPLNRCLYRSKLSSGRSEYVLDRTVTCTAGGRCDVFCRQ